MRILYNSTHDKIEHSLANINWAAYQQRSFAASAAAREDSVLYFLMPDRFSDADEKGYIHNTGNPSVTARTTPPFQFDNDAYITDRRQWVNQGNFWTAGTLILKIRQGHLALRRSRQYLREISASGDAASFGYPAHDRWPYPCQSFLGPASIQPTPP